MSELVEFLKSRGLVREVLDDAGGVYVLQASGRPRATAHLQDELVDRYLQQLASDPEMGPPGTTPETLLEIWALEETGTVGWSSKVFGVRMAKRRNHVEWFSESEAADDVGDPPSGTAYWTAERP